MSPEQAREIDRYRKQEMETRKELKKVRRKLREDIERLGMWVKLVNILLMPALISMVNVALYFQRRYF